MDAKNKVDNGINKVCTGNYKVSDAKNKVSIAKSKAGNANYKVSSSAAAGSYCRRLVLNQRRKSFSPLLAALPSLLFCQYLLQGVTFFALC